MVFLEQDAFRILLKILDLGKYERIVFSDFQTKERIKGENTPHKKYSGKTLGIGSEIILKGLWQLVKEEILLEKILNGNSYYEVNPFYKKFLIQFKEDYSSLGFPLSDIFGLKHKKGTIKNIKESNGKIRVNYSIPWNKKRKPRDYESIESTGEILKKEIEERLNRSDLFR